MQLLFAIFVYEAMNDKGKLHPRRFGGDRSRVDVLFACLTGRHHNPEPVPYLAETANSFPVETAGHTGRNSRESDAMFELEMASDNQRTELYRY